MDEWLNGTKVRTEATTTSLIEFLIGGSACSIPGMPLHYAQQSILFSTIFLYGQGVAGCIEACLYATDDTWPGLAFFTMIDLLLPE
ncbi:hypothetical protein [Kluyvera intermedia]|uniref:hypothetical protein n=1 Tax=Kluyvera intermedia TaxID=61648 RepID=UPI0035260F1C